MQAIVFLIKEISFSALSAAVLPVALADKTVLDAISTLVFFLIEIKSDRAALVIGVEIAHLAHARVSKRVVNLCKVATITAGSEVIQNGVRATRY